MSMYIKFYADHVIAGFYADIEQYPASAAVLGERIKKVNDTMNHATAGMITENETMYLIAKVAAGYAD